MSPLTPPYSPPRSALLRARAQPPPPPRARPPRSYGARTRPCPLPLQRGPGLPTVPHPTPRAAHSGRPQPGAPRWHPLVSLPFPNYPHPRVQRAGASLELRPRPPPRAAAGASPALRGSRARHSHKMSALTELLPAATLRPHPPVPIHRRVSVRQRRRRERRTS